MFPSPLKPEAWFSFCILGGRGEIKGKHDISVANCYDYS